MLTAHIGMRKRGSTIRVARWFGKGIWSLTNGLRRLIVAISPSLALFALVAAASMPAQAQQLNPVAPLSFTMPLHGHAPLPQVIEVTTTSSPASGYFDAGATAYTASGGDWLAVTTTATERTPYPATVSINQSVAQTLNAGTYTGQVVITPTGGQPAIVVPVTLVVAPSTIPFFDNLPGSLDFAVQANGSNPASQQIQIRNAGAGRRKSAETTVALWTRLS